MTVRRSRNSIVQRSCSSTGRGSAGGQWAPQVAALGDEFRCLAPDLPGHGGAAATPFTLTGAADAVAATIDAEAASPAVVVGLSLGGYVAMELAARRPDLVAGLVLAGASAEPIWPRSLAFDGLGLILDTIDEGFLRRVNAWYFRRRYPAAIAEPIVAGGFWFDGGAVAVRSLVGERFEPRLARFSGPSLIVNGEFDLLFRLSQRAFVEAAVDGRSAVLRGAIHLSNLDAPEAFSAAVRRFARRVAAPTA